MHPPLSAVRSPRMPLSRIRLAAALSAAALAAAPAFAAPFDPMRFFNGRVESDGRAKVVFKGTHGLRVHSAGRVEPDGTLILDQKVEEEGEQPRMRAWRMRQVGPGRYAGTISDAEGPVTGETAPDGRFRMAFKMKGGLAVEQWLTPGADGLTLKNDMTIKKFGITVATVQETMRTVR